MPAALSILLIAFAPCIAQPITPEIDLNQFGFRGDGKTDNTQAFKKLAVYLRNSGGNAIVRFKKGIYMAGMQTKSLRRENFFLSGEDVLLLENLKNITIIGESGTVFRYNKGLHFGSFDPTTMQKSTVTKDFYIPQQAAYIGFFIRISKCSNVRISDIELDGNDRESIQGGAYGDVGIQIPYTGIMIEQCQAVQISGIHAHHFGQDGITVKNDYSHSQKGNNVVLLDCRFLFNGRQGMSWTGGNGLTATSCRFESTGFGLYNSNPGAGVDFEAEHAEVSNGYFSQCVFAYNKGCAIVAETGNVKQMKFDSCTFIGVSTWSIWVKKPTFQFTRCRIFGSVVHGFSAENSAEATVFDNCFFSDSAQQGKPTFGQFLVESNDAKMMRFENCIFEATQRKLIWLHGGEGWSPNQLYRLQNCTLRMMSKLPDGDFYAMFRYVNIQGNRFEILRSLQLAGVNASGFDHNKTTNVVLQNEVISLF
jgi:hypothetical protein